MMKVLFHMVWFASVLGLTACMTSQPITPTTHHSHTFGSASNDTSVLANNGLMKKPSVNDAQSIYIRQGLDSDSQYYWMMPYASGSERSASQKAHYALQTRWHNQQPETVRLFVYDALGKRDVTQIRLEVDGAVSEYIAIWPAETISQSHAQEATRQYFDVSYSILQSITHANEAQLTLLLADQGQEQLVLVSQGQHSEAAAGLQRFFNAIAAR